MTGSPQAQPGVAQQQALIDMLLAQAGPRGATYAGRVVQPEQVSSIAELLARVPVDVPDGEGLGILASGPLLLAPPKPFMKLGKKGFDEQRFPYELNVRVTDDIGSFDDSIKGLNRGHAAARARSNWEGASVEYLEGKKKKK